MRYILEFQPWASVEQIQEYLNELDGNTLKQWSRFDHTVLVESSEVPSVTSVVQRVIEDSESHLQLLDFPQDLEIDKKRAFLDGDPTAPPITFSTTNQQDWWKNFVLMTPEFQEETVSIYRRGQGINVYVFDSGITHDHPEFAETQIEDIWTVTPGDYSDPHGHGTAIASVISGQQCGLSAAKIKVVKIFRSDRGTYLSEFLDALETVLDHMNPNGVNIMNCSWSIAKNEYIEEKIRQLIDKNMLVVAAAGNSGAEIGDVTPASMSDVLAVGSYNSDLLPSNFSNYVGNSEISYTNGEVNHGPVNTWAPGEQVWSATRTGGYGYVAGTSISAAIASMILAVRFSGFVHTASGDLLPGYSGRKIRITNHVLDDPHPTGLHTIYANVIGKANLLDLSDPKYAGSTNGMISLSYSYAASMEKHYNNEIQMPVMDDQRQIVLFAGRRNVRVALSGRVVRAMEKAQLLGPLPSWCSIDTDGSLIADSPPENTQGNNDSVDLYDILLRIYPESGSPVDQTIQLRVLPDPGDEQIIEISLLSNFGFNNGCLNDVQFGGTVDQCPTVDSSEVGACDNFCSGPTDCCFGGGLGQPKGTDNDCVCFDIF